MKIESSEIETISNNKKSKISENNELKEVDLETGLAVIDNENDEPKIHTKKRLLKKKVKSKIKV